MSEAALVQVPQCNADSEILKLIAELKDVFENHFDRTWFSLLLDELPVDLRTMRDIRELVAITVLYPGEERLVWQGVNELETFTLTVKHYLLPVLKERLGVSWLLPQKRVHDTQQYILRKFVAFTFPYNLERLRRTTARLRACLLLYYPWLS